MRSGEPACTRCGSTRVWWIRDNTAFECAACHHQTSLTAGTLLEKTRKPLKTWFRAVFEISVRRTGISAKDLQRIMGFGSYKTAWTWLHKLRTATVRQEREPLRPFAQMDETLIGGKGGPHKELVLIASEANGRARLVHAENNDSETLRRFVNADIGRDTVVTTDGHAGYNAKSLGGRDHKAVVQSPSERRESDAVQNCHWLTSGVKRWLLATHAGAVRRKHLQAYLDEFVFRHNRRKTRGVVRIAARLLHALAHRPPRTMRAIIDETRPCHALTHS